MNFFAAYILFNYLTSLTIYAQSKEDKLNQRSFFGLAKSLLIDIISEKSDIGHLILNHAETCPFYCLNDGK